MRKRSGLRRYLSRRQFLRGTFAGAAAAGLGWARPLTAAPGAAGGGAQPAPRRVGGKTREKVSILAVGGWHVGSISDDQTAIRLVRTALDSGVNLLDNAWGRQVDIDSSWTALWPGDSLGP